MKRIEALEKFFEFAMDCAFEGCDLGGNDIQDMAIELGLAKVVPYNPEIHNEDAATEPGEPFIVLTRGDE